MTARRAHPQRLVELLVEQRFLAARALRPQVGRILVAAGTEFRQLDRHQLSLAGRRARHATSATPAIEIAADAIAPPISTFLGSARSGADGSSRPVAIALSSGSWTPG